MLPLLHGFDTLYSQLHAQTMTMDDELKTFSPYGILPAPWDTFCIVVSNSAKNGKLDYNDIYRAILSDEIHRKSMIA